MIETLQQVRELERELYIRLDLTEREQRMLEAIQLMLTKLQGVTR